MVGAPGGVTAVGELEHLARQARRLIVQSIFTAQAGHLGGPLSAVDLLVALYFAVLKVDTSQPRWPNRDRFVLSKGHSSISLYAVLALRGFFPIAELATFDALDTRLQGHPDMTRLDCLDMSTGSLGQGISAAVGMALGAKLQDSTFHTWVMIGDGEIQEGQVWEAALIAARYHLDNLTVILDANGLQQFGWGHGSDLERRPPAEHASAAFRAFGWEVLDVDGHNMAAILDAYRQALTIRGHPTLINAHTVKGKGVSFMEHSFNWHAKVPTQHDVERALQELQDPV